MDVDEALAVDDDWHSDGDFSCCVDSMTCALAAEVRELRAERAKRADVGWGADRAELTVLRAMRERARDQLGGPNRQDAQTGRYILGETS